MPDFYLFTSLRDSGIHQFEYLTYFTICIFLPPIIYIHMMIYLRFLVVCIIAGNDKMVATLDGIEVLSYHCHYTRQSFTQLFSTASHCPEYRTNIVTIGLNKKATRNYEFWVSFPQIFEYGIVLLRLSPMRMRKKAFVFHIRQLKIIVDRSIASEWSALLLMVH